MRQGLYQQSQKQKPLMRSYVKRRLHNESLGTHRVADSVADGEQQQIHVRYGTVRSFCAKPKISEKTFFYPSFFKLAPKRPWRGETSLKFRPGGGNVP
jgi:hypothetical protein